LVRDDQAAGSGGGNREDFMSPVAKPGNSAAADVPVAPAAVTRVLVVDDDAAVRDLLGDVVRSIDCQVVAVGTVAEARRVIAKVPVHVMVADVHLPDGDGIELLAALRKRNPAARAVVITGTPCVATATAAIRAGAVDFVPKPFAADHIAARVRTAVAASVDASGEADRADRKLRKLKSAVRKLNDARKTISQKVDILCNDLVSAYGELSKQLDVVRVQEGFRKTIAPAKDLEGLICQAMDWLMRQTGYANVAVWLAGEDGAPQLGAYMKYTIPGDDRVSEALRRAVLPLAARDGRDAPVRLTAAALKDKFTPKEQHLFKDQQFLAIDCTYLGESLATLVFFRDEQVPFGEQDLETLKTVAPVFAAALAAVVRQSADDEVDGSHGDGGHRDDRGGAASGPEPMDPDARGGAGPRGGHDGFDGGTGGGTADPKKRRPNKPDPADWWKRGEAPPF
jgi:FixJ family two-component response regulator